MLKISHIKIRPIHLILGGFLGLLSTCYMPRGAFMIEGESIHFLHKDTLGISLPTEFQVYNYFRITYVKNREVFIGAKTNDSIIVFLPRIERKKVRNCQFRVEAGIIPFLEKK